MNEMKLCKYFYRDFMFKQKREEKFQISFHETVEEDEN